MTKLLFLPLPYQRTWEATVTDIKTVGEHTHVITKETLFIPTTTGGPAMDRGSIESIPVNRVFMYQDDIIHELSGTLEHRPSTVTMELDWANRRRTLDAQTALLLFGNLLERDLNLRLRGFCENRNELLIDTTKGTFTPAMVETLEHALNHLIEQALPIEGRWINPSEAERYPLRQGTWANKALWISSFGKDHVAGPYPHHQNTAHLGQILILDVTEETHHLRWHIKAGTDARADERENRKLICQLKSLWKTDDILEKARTIIQQESQLQKDTALWAQYLLKDLKPPTKKQPLFTTTYRDLPSSSAEAITKELRRRYPIVCWQLVHQDEARIYWQCDPSINLPLTVYLKELSQTFRFVAQGHDQAMTLLIPTKYSDELLERIVIWVKANLTSYPN